VKRANERRGLQAAARWFETQLSGLKGLEFYQERRLAGLGLNPVETKEELDIAKLQKDLTSQKGRKYKGAHAK
jgi:hypothetical protein